MGSNMQPSTDSPPRLELKKQSTPNPKPTLTTIELEQLDSGAWRATQLGVDLVGRGSNPAGRSPTTADSSPRPSTNRVRARRSKKARPRSGAIASDSRCRTAVAYRPPRASRPTGYARSGSTSCPCRPPRCACWCLGRPRAWCCRRQCAYPPSPDGSNGALADRDACARVRLGLVP